LELLVIVSVVGIWCFENWNDSIEKGVSWLRTIIEALVALPGATNEPIYREFPDKTWTPAYQFHKLTIPSQEAPAELRLTDESIC
jgi:hypothetical protein